MLLAKSRSLMYLTGYHLDLLGFVVNPPSPPISMVVLLRTFDNKNDKYEGHKCAILQQSSSHIKFLT